MNIGKIPAKIARLAPHKEALVDIPNDRRMTFGELDERVRRLANALVEELNLQRGDRVAILSKNCIEYMEVYYACARCGLIAQPLNWRLGTAELARILRDGEPSAVVVSGEYADEQARLREEVTVDHWLGFGAGVRMATPGSIHWAIRSNSPDRRPSSDRSTDRVPRRTAERSMTAYGRSSPFGRSSRHVDRRPRSETGIRLDLRVS